LFLVAGSETLSFRKGDLFRAPAMQQARRLPARRPRSSLAR
jgi:hypothetical protein